jgi:hypothetical protein
VAKSGVLFLVKARMWKREMRTGVVSSSTVLNGGSDTVRLLSTEAEVVVLEVERLLGEGVTVRNDVDEVNQTKVVYAAVCK